MSNDDPKWIQLRKKMARCLALESPKSFLFYAGAGTGKTKAVVEAMKILQERYGAEFQRSGQRVAVITYTNAACDEIKQRIEYNPIFAVSTIHSFAWEQIRTFHIDIAACVKRNLISEVAELEKLQSKGKRGSNAATAREVKIDLIQNRILSLGEIKQFTYNPNGDNSGKNSLDHTEVIATLTEFLDCKRNPLMCRILIRRHPVILIDESQDTQKDLIDALIQVQTEHSEQFCLGLFGDMMQRIYPDGKADLKDSIPNNWETLSLFVNHRCPKRVLSLINKVRLDADGVQQKSPQDAQEGVIRLFLVDNVDNTQKTKFEEEAARLMAEVTSDNTWTNKLNLKVLILEHLMAARRGGFDDFFNPLYEINKFKTGLRDGTLNGVTFFKNQVYPLVHALQADDKFEVARIVKKYSPILSSEGLRSYSNPMEKVRIAAQSVSSIHSLWNDGSDPSLFAILNEIKKENLFQIPDIFSPILSVGYDGKDIDNSSASHKEDDSIREVVAWREALSASFKQFEAYYEYISEKSQFGTHQGIKGLEFPHVMVILSDYEARGRWFNYEKLFGSKALSSTDERNRSEGKDTSIDRTRRLFYVTCSRAERSLAVVVYTKEVDKVESFILTKNWFEEDEVVRL